MLFYLLTIGIGTLIYRFYRFYADRSDYPPGPRPLPIIGNLLDIDSNRFDQQLIDWGLQYGGMFTLYLPRPTVIITDYQMLKEALVNNGTAFSGRPDTAMTRLISPNRLGFMSDGALWQQRRRFALHSLKQIGVGRSLMESKVLNAIDNVLLADLQMHARNHQPIDVHDSLNRTIGDIIADVLLGHNFDGQMERFYDLMALMDENVRLIMSPMIKLLDVVSMLRYVPHLVPAAQRIMDNTNKLNAFFMSEVRLHEQTMQVGHLPNEPTDYIDAFLRERKRRNQETDEVFSIDQLVASLRMLWLAAQESSVTTLLWMFYFMTKHPEMQEKLRQEIREVLGSERSPTMTDKAKLPYCCAFIQETHRCANINRLNLAHRVLSDTKLKSYTLKRNTIVIPQHPAIFWDKRLYSNPSVFNPDRFIDIDTDKSAIGADNKSIIVKFKPDERIIPFGIGKRSCLGESLAKVELFLVLVRVIQKYRLRQEPNVSLPDEMYDNKRIGLTKRPKQFRFVVEELG